MILLFAALAAPDLSLFDDAIHHWQNRHGSDYARYEPQQVNEIAGNILLYQRDNGGWIENQDPQRILTEAEKAEFVGEKAKPGTSFDNRNIYSQVEYLMAAFDQTGDASYRDAALRGLDFTLSQQMPACGGWPHTLPPSQSYHDKLTIADEVTSGNLRLLRKIALGQAPFASLDDAVRERAAVALKRGDDCVLRLQILQNGMLTGWAGQYDPVTLAPAQGRTFELPAIVSQETVAMVDYLVSIDNPSPEVVASVEAAVAWLQRSRIDGYRIVEVPLAEPVKYDYHTATFDRQLVADPAAPSLWARFYDLNDNSVVLANRDSRRVATYGDIHPERRSGYGWYGTWPHKLIEVDYPGWKAGLPNSN